MSERLSWNYLRSEKFFHYSKHAPCIEPVLDRQQPRDRRVARGSEVARIHRCAGAHHGRERRRQGASGPGSAQLQPPRELASRRDQLRQRRRVAPRVRAVRPRQRELHRRRTYQNRLVGIGRSRDGLSRRGRRDVPANAGAPVAFPRERRDPAGRQHAAFPADRRPRHRGHQPQPVEGFTGGVVPRGPVLSLECPPRQSFAFAEAARRYRALDGTLPGDHRWKTWRSDAAHIGSGRASASRIRLAGQRPRASKCHRDAGCAQGRPDRGTRGPSRQDRDGSHAACRGSVRQGAPRHRALRSNGPGGQLVLVGRPCALHGPGSDTRHGACRRRSRALADAGQLPRPGRPLQHAGSGLSPVPQFPSKVTASISPSTRFAGRRRSRHPTPTSAHRCSTPRCIRRSSRPSSPWHGGLWAARP